MKKTLVLLCLLLAPLTLADEANLTIDGVVVTETSTATLVAFDWSAAAKDTDGGGVTFSDVSFKVTIYNASGGVLGTASIAPTIYTTGCPSCAGGACAATCTLWYCWGGLCADETMPCENAAGPCQDGTSAVCYCNLNPVGGPSLEVGVTGGKSLKAELIFSGDVDQSDNSLTVSY